MSASAPARFHWRGFVSLFVTLSFTLLVASGIVLYVAPPGRVAHWTRWTLGLLEKSAWQSVHTVFAFLFVVAGAFHLYFNWRILWSYLQSKLTGGVRLRRELALATGLVVAVVALTLAGVPPFATVMELGERAKHGWTQDGGEPPVPHAEILTLERLAAITQMPLDRVLDNLEQAGVEGAERQSTIAALATVNGRTPQQVWTVLRGSETPKELPSGRGYGWKSIGEVCAQLDLPPEEGLARLRGHGIEATTQTRMRALADRHDRSPHDLLEILTGA